MKIECWENEDGYFIKLIHKDRNYISDKQIARLLNIEYKEYCNFLYNYNSRYTYNCGILFYNESDCDNCIKALKEKYSDKLIYFTLTS
jgi:hypothetical protein